MNYIFNVELATKIGIVLKIKDMTKNHILNVIIMLLKQGVPEIYLAPLRKALSEGTTK